MAGIVERSDVEVGSDLEEVVADLEELSAADLTEWEDGFVSDMLDRLERFGERTFISDRQREQIDRMKTKYL